MEKDELIKMKLNRSYSIDSSRDTFNILNKRCPDYAVRWGIKSNIPHWDAGHNFYVGNGIKPDNNDPVIETLREILSSRLNTPLQEYPIVFCDLDGVLADFNDGIYRLFGKNPDELEQGLMWSQIRKTDGFFENLEWMEGGKFLWNSIKKYHPIILTGCPNGNWAEEQKLKWCARELGDNIRVITCKTKDKDKYCIQNSILIDDRDKNKSKWEQHFSKFILHTNAISTISEVDNYLDSYKCLH